VNETGSRLFRKQSEREGRTLLITESACFFYDAAFLRQPGMKSEESGTSGAFHSFSLLV
jgi:hypothetical protein